MEETRDRSFEEQKKGFGGAPLFGMIGFDLVQLGTLWVCPFQSIYVLNITNTNNCCVNIAYS